MSCVIVYFACSTMFTVTTFDAEKTHFLNSTSFSFSRTIEETNQFIDDWLPSILILFSIWMLLTSIDALHQIILKVANAGCNFLKLSCRVIKMIHTLLVIAAVLFVILPSSMVTFVSISNRVRSLVPKAAFDIYQRSHPYMVASTYGLFRRMTGMGKSTVDAQGRTVSVVSRPEIIVEGSLDGQKWEEIHFLYKPGDVHASPTFVAPHQPRLDLANVVRST